MLFSACLQRWWVGVLAARRASAAALVIQRVYRGFLARQYAAGLSAVREHERQMQLVIEAYVTR